MHDLKWALVNTVAHDAHVEPSRRCLAVIDAQLGGQVLRPGNMNSKPAARPKEELHQSFEVSEVGLRLRMVFRKRECGMVKDRAIGLLQSDRDRKRFSTAGLRQRTRGFKAP